MISGAAAQRPGVSLQEAGNATYLAPLHTRLAGRARFKSRALYRAGALQTAVETRLRAVAGVQNVTVNTLTGSLLVEFDPALTLAALLPALNAALAELPLPSLRTSWGKSGTDHLFHFRSPENVVRPLFSTYFSRNVGQRNIL